MCVRSLPTVVCLCLLLSGSARSELVTLGSFGDTVVNRVSGAVDFMPVSLEVRSASNQESQSFFAFNLEPIDDGATINQATLVLNATSQSSGPATMTFSFAGNEDGLITPIDLLIPPRPFMTVDSSSIVLGENFVSIDPSLIQAKIGQSGDIFLFLQGSDAIDIHFTSNFSAEPSLSPRLLLDITSVPEPSSAMVLFGTAAVAFTRRNRKTTR